jgi:hypothetical protein
MHGLILRRLSSMIKATNEAKSKSASLLCAHRAILFLCYLPATRSYNYGQEFVLYLFQRGYILVNQITDESRKVRAAIRRKIDYINCGFEF